jgi:CBS domain-containing membrane protein/CBS domain-containing protein
LEELAVSVIERSAEAEIAAPSAAGEPVDQVMSTSVVALRADEDVATALAVLRVGGLRHLVVIDGDARFLGMVSDRLLVDQESPRPGPTLVRIKDVLFDTKACVPPGTTIAEAARRMLQHSAGALAVVDAESKVLGVVTGADLLRALVGRS